MISIAVSDKLLRGRAESRILIDFVTSGDHLVDAGSEVFDLLDCVAELTLVQR